MRKFNSIDIPQNIDEITRDSIKRGKDFRNRRKYKKMMVASVASIMVITGVVGVGIINPSIANAMPQLQKIFEDLNKNLGLDKEHTKYTQEIGQSQSKNGTTISIDEAVSDGHNLYLTYVIKSENKLPRQENYETMGNTLNLETEINIDGGIYSGGKGLIGYYKDEYTYIGMESYEIDFKGKKAPKQFDVEVSVVSIYSHGSDGKVNNRIIGPFDFNLNIDTKSDVKVLDVNQSKGKFKISTVELSPYSINVNLEVPKSFLGEKESREPFSTPKAIVYAPGLGEIAGHTYSKEGIKDNGNRVKGRVVYDSILINYRERGYKEIPEYIVVKFLNYKDGKKDVEFKVYLNK